MAEILQSNGIVNDSSKDGDDFVSISINPIQFLNIDYGLIGRTVSTKSEPNTSSKFHFWVADREEQKINLEIGNIVAALDDNGDELTFGVITEMRSYSDVESFIADYLSHNFGEAGSNVPTDVAQVVVVTCQVMRNLSSTTKPVSRSRVHFPNELGIQFAYGIVNERGEYIFSGSAIPIGVFENGDGTVAPISIDEDFVLGPEGAHLNISGISGLASKTSAMQFIIKSLLTSTQKRIAVVMFNLKGKDLLYIDQLNPRLVTDRTSQKIYKDLNIPIEAFVKAIFYAPADPQDPDGTQSLRELNTQRFTWDLQMIYNDIPSLFDQLDWDDRMEGVWFVIRREIENGSIITYANMLDWVNRQITRAGQSRPPQIYIRGNHIYTWNKMRSHLQRFPQAFSGVIATAGRGNDIPWNAMKHGSLYVIDIHMLNDRGKRLVFGRAMRALSNMLESGQSNLDSVVVFVDELNKFAPSGTIRTPLKARLIDITARGRSAGLVLFGAEQFASDVEKEIVENCSTFLFGRTEANELRTPNYSAFSNEIKTKLTMLPQGHLLAKFAKFPQPIFIKFPYPPCIPGDQFIVNNLNKI